MSSENLPILTNPDFRKFLECAPLYSWWHFKLTQLNRSNVDIGEIESHCEVCDQSRPFQDSYTLGKGRGHSYSSPMFISGVAQYSFACASCRKSNRTYLVQQIVENDFVKFQKYGELPRSRIPRDKRLQKFLKDDRDNYEKAVLCLSHEYGIAAFAYFRRIVESNIIRLLDLIQEDVQASGEDSEALKAIQSLRDGSPMSEKIKVANMALPKYLQPNGLNPLGRLYQVLSEGVHSLPEAECLKKAKATSECLAFLVSELASRKEHRAHFESMINKL